MPNPFSLQVIPSAAIEWNELNIQDLYYYLGPKTNQSTGIYATEGNIVYDGEGPDAEVVGCLQGLHSGEAGNLINCCTLVFKNERFGGSTLQVTGIKADGMECAIAGGTGQFAMANGVMSWKPLKQLRNKDGSLNNYVKRFSIRAFWPVFKGTRYPVTKIGLWGGTGGSPMDITESPSRLESITVYTGGVVDSIAFSYLDYTGQNHSAGRWGGPGGQPHTVQLAGSEFVTEVSGTVGKYNGYTVISSIKFVTNLNNTYGPWGDGKDDNSPFTVPVQPGSAIVGFFARAAPAGFLDAIGVYVRPL